MSTSEESGQPLFRDPGASLEARVDDLVSRLTTAEKISLLHQRQPAVPRLGIAAFRAGTEALHGVAWLGTATVFPQAIGLASTWNPELVRAVGDVTGTEARGFHDKDPVEHGLNLWAPVVNPLRDPRWGRNEEGYSEDPLLTSVMGTAYASGLRGDHPVYLKTAPTLKHFLGYNNETDRCTTSSNLRARVLHEYELPCFRGPIAAGAAVAVMPSYNLVNGRPAHLSPWLNEHLRSWTDGEIAVMSDAMAPSNVAGVQAYHKTQAEAHAAMLRAGLDSFTDEDSVHVVTVEHVTEALARGLITEDYVDRAVGRVLALRVRLGEFDPPGGNPYASISQDVIDQPAHRRLALEAARQSVVLLKNAEGLLPLDPAAGSIAVIGTHAGVLFEDWYSGTLPYAVTPHDGIAALNRGQTTFEEGVDRIALRTLDGRYLTAEPGRSVTVSRGSGDAVEFDLFDWGHGVCTLRSVRTGRFLASTPEARLVTERTMPGGWNVHELFGSISTGGGTCVLRNVVLERFVAVRDDGVIEFVSDEADATAFAVEVCRYGLARAAARAAEADAAIVVVGNDPHINGRETQDRADLKLPPAQAELVEMVCQLNPRTVLVVVSSYPYALVWEDEHVPAILWTSHGGQELGRALAEVVFGLSTPSGKLTQTWYRDADDLPDLFDYDIIRTRSTYLYFDGEPLYPFGHGLSYTTFGYGDLVLSSPAVRPGEELTVSVEVANTGAVPGAEVVQLYGRQLESRVPQPLRRLLAFERVTLSPGERRLVQFVLRGDDFWHWDVVSGRELVETAVHELWAGPSSQVIASRAEIQVVGETPPPRRLAGATLRADCFDDYAEMTLADETREQGTVVLSTASGAWLRFDGLRVDDRVTHATVRLAGQTGGQAVVRVRLDDPATGPVVADAVVTLSCDPHTWQQITVPALPAMPEPSTRDVYVVVNRAGVRLAEVIFSEERTPYLSGPLKT
ncbi:glycoside hydrolase family 3 protein [Lentzea flava]|uniref:Beta-glucosidase n=1 Tax=Lentzea flava TaxID=103732 RepID=A0ABQ2UM55_9PSEU|nr:glycoside hydrolase family 3 protein [Lentzea flava]MCP2200605.1 beta-glucosidase [Lentzea flava]GGU43882.1 beta-glucosidase [Lentzea flava]